MENVGFAAVEDYVRNVATLPELEVLVGAIKERVAKIKQADESVLARKGFGVANKG